MCMMTVAEVIKSRRIKTTLILGGVVKVVNKGRMIEQGIAR